MNLREETYFQLTKTTTYGNYKNIEICVINDNYEIYPKFKSLLTCLSGLQKIVSMTQEIKQEIWMRLSTKTHTLFREKKLNSGKIGSKLFCTNTLHKLLHWYYIKVL